MYINNFQTCACELFSVSIDLRVMCVRVREREREGGETITRTTTSTLWKKYHGKQPARWVLHCYRQTPSVHLTSAGWLAVANPGIPKKEGQTVHIHQISPGIHPKITQNTTQAIVQLPPTSTRQSLDLQHPFPLIKNQRSSLKQNPWFKVLILISSVYWTNHALRR